MVIANKVALIARPGPVERAVVYSLQLQSYRPSDPAFRAPHRWPRVST